MFEEITSAQRAENENTMLNVKYSAGTFAQFSFLLLKLFIHSNSMHMPLVLCAHNA